MKFRFVLFAVIATVLFLNFSTSYAQRTMYNYSHSISGDPLELAINHQFLVTYEHQTAPINSFTIFGSYYHYSYSSFGLGDWGWSAFGLGGSYRWYPKLFDDGKRPLEGFSAGPAAGFLVFSQTVPAGYTSENSTVFFFIGGEAAYKWVFGGFVLEPIIRLTIPLTTLSNSGYGAFGGGVNLGYAW